MGKRFFCLVCAMVFLASSIIGLRASAQKWSVQNPAVDSHMPVPAKTRTVRRPNPLISAMFLVLAGIGISLLFDHKEN